MKRRLKPSEIRLAKLLVGSSGLVARERIREAFWGADPEGGPDNMENIISIMVCNLRGALRELGVDRAVMTDRGAGYVVAADKRRDMMHALLRLEEARLEHPTQ